LNHQTRAILADNTFNFDHLLEKAIQNENGTHDDTEGYPFQPLFQLEKNNPLDHESDVELSSSENNSPIPSTSTHIPRKRTATSVVKHQKLGGKKRRRIKRQQDRKNRSFGDYTIRPSTIKNHIKSAQKVSGQLNFNDAPVTKVGYTAVNSEGYGRTFTLEEMVGPDSEFQFELHTWDGR
jgi:hypothetical protein